MKYQIDQSGKIEDTAKNTVLAYSNGKQRTVLINRRTKRKLQEAFRRCGARRLYIYQTFAVGLFYLIEDLEKPTRIIIDTEYPGKDEIIRNRNTLLSLRELGTSPASTMRQKMFSTAKRRPQEF